MQIQISWIYTVCKSKVFPGSAGQGLKTILCILPEKQIHSFWRISFFSCLRWKWVHPANIQRRNNAVSTSQRRRNGVISMLCVYWVSIALKSSVFSTYKLGTGISVSVRILRIALIIDTVFSISSFTRWKQDRQGDVRSHSTLTTCVSFDDFWKQCFTNANIHAHTHTTTPYTILTARIRTDRQKWVKCADQIGRPVLVYTVYYSSSSFFKHISRRLIIKQSFLPSAESREFKKNSCQLLAKICVQITGYRFDV